MEILLAAGAVIRDLFVPTFILLGLAVVSLGLTVGWTMFQLGLFMPVLNHITGGH